MKFRRNIYIVALVAILSVIVSCTKEYDHIDTVAEAGEVEIDMSKIAFAPTIEPVANVRVMPSGTRSVKLAKEVPAGAIKLNVKADYRPMEESTKAYKREYFYDDDYMQVLQLAGSSSSFSAANSFIGLYGYNYNEADGHFYGYQDHSINKCGGYVKFIGFFDDSWMANLNTSGRPSFDWDSYNYGWDYDILVGTSSAISASSLSTTSTNVIPMTLEHALAGLELYTGTVPIEQSICDMTLEDAYFDIYYESGRYDICSADWTSETSNGDEINYLPFENGYQFPSTSNTPLTDYYGDDFLIFMIPQDFGNVDDSSTYLIFDLYNDDEESIESYYIDLYEITLQAGVITRLYISSEDYIYAYPVSGKTFDYGTTNCRVNYTPSQGTGWTVSAVTGSSYFTVTKTSNNYIQIVNNNTGTTAQSASIRLTSAYGTTMTYSFTLAAKKSSVIDIEPDDSEDGDDEGGNY